MAKLLGTLDEERRRATFDVRKLTYVIDGSPEVTRRKEAMRAVVESDPVFDNVARFRYNYEQSYVSASRKLKRTQELRRELNLDAQDYRYLQNAVNEGTAGYLHEAAFIPTIKGQGDAEQRAKWLPPAEAYAIIGSYAQTELGHGSNVRALETTATYIPETDEIELHSPTLTSTKWWPGGLAFTSTHTVVYAHLLLPKGDGTFDDKGIHAFMLQIRSMEDHKTVPGVMLGSIGPKLGANGIDNGWMRMNHVRVPRRNMMMRFASLSADGTYKKQGHSKAAYGTMVFIRASLVVDSAQAIARAATVAIRYGVVRKQFKMKPAKRSGAGGAGAGTPEGENSVLNYPLYQRRIVPLVAQSYALYFTGKYMVGLYQAFQEGLNKTNDFSLLPELHAASAGLKSFCTSMAAAGVETGRRSGGGHGYTLSCGLGDHANTYVGICTAEGDNYLLTLQTARYLIKNLQKAQTGAALPKTCSYLADVAKLGTIKSPATSKASFGCPKTQAEALNVRAAVMVRRAAETIAGLVGEGASISDAFTSAQHQLYLASNAHCVTIMTTAFNHGVANCQDAAVAKVLRTVCSLFCTSMIEEGMADLLEAGYLSPEQAGWIRESVDDNVAAVREQAVPLTDAFNFSDKFLNSALGRYDGRAYETLFEWARRDPMNDGRLFKSVYEPYLKPLMEARKHLRAKL